MRCACTILYSCVYDSQSSAGTPKMAGLIPTPIPGVSPCLTLGSARWAHRQIGCLWPGDLQKIRVTATKRQGTSPGHP